MATFADIKNRIMQVLNDNFGDVMRFTDSHVQDAINQSIRRLMDYAYQSPYQDEIFSGLLIQEESATVSSGKVTPANTPYSVLAVRTANVPLRRITAKDIGVIQTDSIIGNIDPYFVYPGGTEIIVYGVADASTVYVTYIKQPTTYPTDGSDTTTSPDFPEKFHDFLVWYPAHLLASNVESGYENYAQAFLMKAMEVIGIGFQQEQK